MILRKEKPEAKVGKETAPFTIELPAEQIELQEQMKRLHQKPVVATSGKRSQGKTLKYSAVDRLKA